MEHRERALSPRDAPAIRAPVCQGLHVYERLLWPLEVEPLPGTAGLSTVELRTQLLPRHALAMSAPLIAHGQEGGP